MRNLCYLRCTAGCERDKDRELLLGAARCGGRGGYCKEALGSCGGPSQ